MKKQYLGDGVYVEVDSAGRIVLTTENGIEVTNTIYLDLDILAELNNFIKRLNAL